MYKISILLLDIYDIYIIILDLHYYIIYDILISRIFYWFFRLKWHFIAIYVIFAIMIQFYDYIFI